MAPCFPEVYAEHREDPYYASHRESRTGRKCAVSVGCGAVAYHVPSKLGGLARQVFDRPPSPLFGQEAVNSVWPRDGTSIRVRPRQLQPSCFGICLVEGGLDKSWRNAAHQRADDARGSWWSVFGSGLGLGRRPVSAE